MGLTPLVGGLLCASSFVSSSFWLPSWQGREARGGRPDQQGRPPEPLLPSVQPPISRTGDSLWVWGRWLGGQGQSADK